MQMYRSALEINPNHEEARKVLDELTNYFNQSA
jgi:hypothetical protein